MDYFVDFASSINYIEAILAISIILFSHLYILKKSYCNLADPFLIFCIFNSFSIVTTWFISGFTNNYNHVVDLIFFNICFFSASIIFKAKPNKLKLKNALNSFRGPEANVFMGVLATLTIFSTLILWIFVGIPFLSEDPSSAKVTMYQGGFGFVRYLHFIAPPILSLFAMLEIVRAGVPLRKKYLMHFYIIASAIVAVSAGSKSSLLFLLFNIGIIIYISNDKAIILKFKKLLLIVLTLACGVTLLILNYTTEGATKGVILRLFASGDIYFFWYLFDLAPTLSKFRPFDFLLYLLSPLSGMLGIAKQEFPIGAVVMNEAVNYPLTSFGPNAQLPVLMRMYFSEYSFIASGLFGFIFLYLRTKSYRLIENLGPSGFYLFVVLYFGATTIFVDINYFMSLISASLLILILVYGISMIIVSSSKKIMKTPNNKLFL